MPRCSPAVATVSRLPVVVVVHRSVSLSIQHYSLISIDSDFRHFQSKNEK